MTTITLNPGDKLSVFAGKSMSGDNLYALRVQRVGSKKKEVLFSSFIKADVMAIYRQAFPNAA